MTEPPRKRMVKLPTGGLEGGRGKPARLKTAKQRTPSQQAWLERQVNDPFAAKARALGYRSRAAFKRADPMRPIFEADRAHMVGTSGAITSLAGMHLRLPRYDRNRVDGIWMTRSQCDAAAGGLLALSAAERAAQPCIGPDRADLVLAGAAILQAVQELWPCSRVRVADRGLREGILLSLMAERSQRRRRKRRRGRGGTKAAA